MFYLFYILLNIYSYQWFSLPKCFLGIFFIINLNICQNMIRNFSWSILKFLNMNSFQPSYHVCIKFLLASTIFNLDSYLNSSVSNMPSLIFIYLALPFVLWKNFIFLLYTANMCSSKNNSALLSIKLSLPCSVSHLTCACPF